MKKCPTEAIRVRNGKACIIEERCVECGVCIRACPNKAIIAITDELGELENYRYNIVLPSPVLYTQFPPEYTVSQILTALRSLGFDEVFETAIGVDLLASYIDVDKTAGSLNLQYPLISSSCPVVTRLIQGKFPSLLDHLLPFRLPVEIATSLFIKERCLQLGLKPEEVGIFYVTSCPAEVTALRQRISENNEQVKIISIKQIYSQIMKKLVGRIETQVKSQASANAACWCITGGETAVFNLDSYLTVDGVENVMTILTQVEMGKLNCVKYIEAKACIGGCVGGVLAVENQFIARRKAQQFIGNVADFSQTFFEKKYSLSRKQICAGKIEHRPVFRLDSDLSMAIKKIKLIEQIESELPGLDCGSCGAPTCKALAEDIVQGSAEWFDCVFIVKNEINRIVEQIKLLNTNMEEKDGKEKSKELLGFNDYRRIFLLEKLSETNEAMSVGEAQTEVEFKGEAQLSFLLDKLYRLSGKVPPAMPKTKVCKKKEVN